MELLKLALQEQLRRAPARREHVIGNMAVYAALTEPGDTVMTIPQPVGGHSSNRLLTARPASAASNILDVAGRRRNALEVDLDAFAVARPAPPAPSSSRSAPSMTLVPAPGARRSSEIVKRVGRHRLL